MFSIPPNNHSKKHENPLFESIHNPFFSPISQAKSEQIKASFIEMTKDLNYSSLPVFLEFLTYLRNKHTSQDWLKELDAFAPHSFISLLNKYHAGNGALVALGSKEFIRGLNESCMVVAESRPYSHLFNLSILKSPIDGGAIAWDSAKKLLDKKTYVFCLYLEEDKKGKPSKPITLKQNFKDNHSIEQFDTWGDFEKEFQSLNSEALENYSHPFEFLKALMRITFIYTVIKRDSQEVLNINLIDGLISIKTAQNDNFIKNEHHEASFSVIKMIESPDAMVKIIENDATKEIPAKEALNLILKNYGDYFHLPQDFGVNLLFFFTNRIKFLNEIILPPASAKDRSKYKKSDRDQFQKQVEALPLIESPDKELLIGRVLSIKSEGIIVEHEHHFLLCSLRGLLKKEKSHFKNLVTVGDWVLFEKINDKEGLIFKIQSRHSTLSRADNLSRRKEQLIAANVDQVLITLSVVSPPLKLGLPDRYIIAAQKGNMSPVIVFNKIDLLNKTPIEPNLQKEGELFIELATAYKNLGIPVIAVSMITGEGIVELKMIMKDKTSVFSGQSGVGKSSLINIITGLELETNEIVEKTQKGSHTTSSAKLIPLDFGGWCIDTPGIKSFGIWDLSKDEIEQYFAEIFVEGHQCRYPDCAHIHENECAVKKSVDEGKISPLRYMSYFSLIHDISQQHVRR